MADPRQQANLNTLLKWSIENSDVSVQNGANGGDGASQQPTNGPTSVRAIDNAPSDGAEPLEAVSRGPTRLDPGILDAVFGGPSDADLMKASMAAVCNPEVSLEEKLVAFDNFEQLVESIDNANNIASLNLWSPLIETLESPEIQLRMMACWCIGTAVQNNEKAQETALTVGAVPRLVSIATGGEIDGDTGAGTTASSGDAEKNLRRKACYAISSSIRNYQPSMDAAVKALPADMQSQYQGLDSTDMEAVDKLMDQLRNFGA